MNTDLTINNYDSDLAFLNIKDTSKPINKVKSKVKVKKFTKKNEISEDNCDFIDD